MKLIVCTQCSDVFSLIVGKSRACQCGESEGYYSELAPGHANVRGPCYLIGFANDSFIAALRARKDRGAGNDFTAFVLSEGCTSVSHRGEDHEEVELT